VKHRNDHLMEQLERGKGLLDDIADIYFESLLQFLRGSCFLRLIRLLHNLNFNHLIKLKKDRLAVSTDVDTLSP